MKKLVAAVLAVGLVLTAACGLFTKRQLDVNWIGDVDTMLAEQVSKDVETALTEHKVLRVRLESPGGGILSALDVVKTIEAAKEKGLIVEIHARTICASACTVILGAGTKGYRIVNRRTLTLIHALQVGGGLFAPPACMDIKAAQNIQDPTGRIFTTLILNWMAELYAKESGQTIEQTMTWMDCSKEISGDGRLMIMYGLADYLE